jgi:hypothetical protein
MNEMRKQAQGDLRTLPKPQGGLDNLLEVGQKEVGLWVNLALFCLSKFVDE